MMDAQDVIIAGIAELAERYPATPLKFGGPMTAEEHRVNGAFLTLCHQASLLHPEWEEERVALWMRERLEDTKAQLA